MQRFAFHPSGSLVVSGITTVKIWNPADGKLEIRVRGPMLFPGYLDEPGANAEAFDDEGFFRTGKGCGGKASKPARAWHGLFRWL